MKKHFRISSVAFMLFLFALPAWAQVEGVSEETEGTYRIEKRVPKGADSSVFIPDGKAKRYYIIQLARFEKMYGVPDQFPKGTTLWFNPDIGVEALLIQTEMYRTFEAAKAAAERIKAEGIYPNAFARPHPFIVRYD